MINKKLKTAKILLKMFKIFKKNNKAGCKLDDSQARC